MTTAFAENIELVHKELYSEFGEYRDQLTDVLFYGNQISRQDLKGGKDEFVEALRQHVDSIRQILLPAVTLESGDDISPADLMASLQDKLLDRLEHTSETIDYFANPDQPKEKRNNAAREALKDLYRLDDSLRTYFELIEEHYLPAGREQLDEDEQEQLLSELQSVATV